MLGFQCFGRQQEIRCQVKRKASLILGINSNSVIFDQVLTPVVPCVLADMRWGWQHNKRTGHSAVKAMNKPCQCVALANDYQEEAQMNWKEKEHNNLSHKRNQVWLSSKSIENKYTNTNTNTKVWPGCRGELGWSGEAGYRTDPSSDCLIVLLPLTTCSWNKSKCSVNLCSNLWLFFFSLRTGMVSWECFHHNPISR